MNTIHTRKRGGAYAIGLKRKETRANSRERKLEIPGLACGNKMKGSQNNVKGAMNMDCEYIKRFVRKRLTEMEAVIVESAPVYEGNVDVRENILHSDYFIISYINGFFVISFEYGSPVTYVAAIMKKLAPKFELSIGEPYYFSDDGEMYWGDEGQEKYLADFKKEIIKERTGAPRPQSTKKDKEMRN